MGFPDNSDDIQKFYVRNIHIVWYIAFFHAKQRSIEVS